MVGQWGRGVSSPREFGVPGTEGAIMFPGQTKTIANYIIEIISLGHILTSEIWIQSVNTHFRLLMQLLVAFRNKMFLFIWILTPV